MAASTSIGLDSDQDPAAILIAHLPCIPPASLAVWVRVVSTFEDIWPDGRSVSMQISNRLLVATLFASLFCLQPLSAQSRNDPQTMISLWGQANGQCRGGSGNDPRTPEACDERDAYGKRLNQLGWCYGRKGELGYQMRWHRCGPTSLRLGG